MHEKNTSESGYIAAEQQQWAAVRNLKGAVARTGHDLKRAVQDAKMLFVQTNGDLAIGGAVTDLERAEEMALHALDRLRRVALRLGVDADETPTVRQAVPR